MVIWLLACIKEMTKRLTILILILIELGCSTTKGQYTYQICVQKSSDPSKIIKNEVIGIADTTVAFLSGQVIDKETNKPLLYANVSLTNIEIKKVYGMTTKEKGEYSITVPAGNYLLEVKYVGYSDLTKNLTLGTGEMRKIEVEMGQGGAFVIYKIKSDKKLNKRKLHKKAEELKKEK